jgi:hypothetical protein
MWLFRARSSTTSWPACAPPPSDDLAFCAIASPVSAICAEACDLRNLQEEMVRREKERSNTAQELFDTLSNWNNL